jgi:hypothetical protein
VEDEDKKEKGSSASCQLSSPSPRRLRGQWQWALWKEEKARKEIEIETEGMGMGARTHARRKAATRAERTAVGGKSSASLAAKLTSSGTMLSSKGEARTARAVLANSVRPMRLAVWSPGSATWERVQACSERPTARWARCRVDDGVVAFEVHPPPSSSFQQLSYVCSAVEWRPSQLSLLVYTYVLE